MTKHVSYKCNLCRDTKASCDMHGVYFTHNKVELRMAENCENHICTTCAQGIVNEYKTRPPLKPAPSPM